MQLRSILLPAFLLLGVSAPVLAQTPTSSPSGPAKVGIPGLVETQLAGRSLGSYPHFEYVRAFNAATNVEIGVDTTRFPALAGKTLQVFVVESRTVAGWAANRVLVDAGDGPDMVTFAAGTLQGNRFVVDTGVLSSSAGIDPGIGYDVVIDVDGDGKLSAGDLVDGYDDEEPGFAVFHDLTKRGPLAVTELLYSGGFFLGQNTFRPTIIPSSMGKLPLVVVSHGNGHDYQWYGHIGRHLASYGYIVMSHQNNTGPGIESASQTTLTNTDYFLNNLATIDGGSMLGKVDASRIAWIGHSRGGEGIVRAYDKIHDGTFTPTSGYGLDEVRVLSSMAPTDFLGFSSSHPHGANYHLWTAAADSDVNGCASCNICQTFHLHDRADGFRQAVTVYGAGHADFHDAFTSPWATGPCLVGKANTHLVLLPYLLALFEHYVDGNGPIADYLWRQRESFAPIGHPTDPCAVVNAMYRRGSGPGTGTYVIDDFQTEPSLNVASSGASVAFAGMSLAEGRMDDQNSTFTHDPNDTFNGFTVAGIGDQSRGIVFEFANVASIRWTLVPEARDVSGFDFLSFRACQATRHPLTIGDLGDTTFEVALVDGSGVSSAIGIGAYGGGIEEPYQRTSCGIGAGWANEFETIRIRLTDFLAEGSGLDLSDVRDVELRLGPPHGTASGRLGFDDLQLETD